MDTKRVEVLHVTDGDTVVVRIAHHFVLNLLPTLQRLFDEDLRRQGQRSRSHVTELFFVVGKTGTETTKGVGSADNDGIPNLVCSIQGLIDGTDGNRVGDRDIDLIEDLGEEISVLAKLEGMDTSAQNLDTVSLKQTHALHLHTQVQRGLAAK